MGLRDDVALVCTIVDSTLHGALPYLDAGYTTAHGRTLADLVMRLRARWLDELEKRANADALLEELDGQRATNAILTAEIERLQAMLEVSDETP